MLNENKTTIASYLQKNFIDSSSNLEVVNCGIPGRDIERMNYQIRHEKISTNDFVFLLTGFYEFDDLDNNIKIWCEYIKRAYKYVNKVGGKFIYVNLPTILEMENKSSEE